MDALFLAFQYLLRHKLRTGVLVIALALTIYLPVTLSALVEETGRRLMDRAENTPMVIGSRGSALELVLNTLYFETESPPVMPFGEVQRIQESGLAEALPLYARFSASGFRVVGISYEYFEFRGLEFSSGRPMGMLGECVLGAEAAKQLEADVGGHVVTSPESVFDLAGVYPLKMPVVGILAPRGTPDDHAIFVDIRAAWIIEGLGHGHDDVAETESAILEQSDSGIVANASLKTYTEITPDNVAGFHFHGDTGEFPITAIIAVPHDAKSSALLEGQYLGDTQPLQIVRPTDSIGELMDTVFTVQRFALIGAAFLGVCTFALIGLIVLLSLRLRQREIQTLHKIGASRRRIAFILSTEIALVFVMACLLAGTLGLMTWALADEFLQSIIIAG